MIHLFDNNPYTLKISPKMESASKIIIKELKKSIHKPISDMVYNISRYNLIETKRNCGGYFDMYNQEIAINTNDEYLYGVIFHEIGHFIHLENGYDFYGDTVLSYQIKMEQEVEAFSCRAYKEIFGLYKPEKEWAYYDKQSVDFLAEWYEGYYENDIL